MPDPLYWGQALLSDLVMWSVKRRLVVVMVTQGASEPIRLISGNARFLTYLMARNEAKL